MMVGQNEHKRKKSQETVVHCDGHLQSKRRQTERPKGSTLLSSPSFSRDATPFTIAHVAAPIRAQVEARLRQAIVTGHFLPGSRLIERELCLLLGVSRTSIREALRQLEG